MAGRKTWPEPNSLLAAIGCGGHDERCECARCSSEHRAGCASSSYWLWEGPKLKRRLVGAHRFELTWGTAALSARKSSTIPILEFSRWRSRPSWSPQGRQRTDLGRLSLAMGFGRAILPVLAAVARRLDAGRLTGNWMTALLSLEVVAHPGRPPRNGSRMVWGTMRPFRV